MKHRATELTSIIWSLLFTSCAPEAPAVAHPPEPPDELTLTGCQPDLASRIVRTAQHSLVVLSCEAGRCRPLFDCRSQRAYERETRHSYTSVPFASTYCALGWMRPEFNGLDHDNRLVGEGRVRLDYSHPGPGRDQLSGNCDGATHFIRLIMLGSVKAIELGIEPVPSLSEFPTYIVTGERVITGDAQHCEVPGCLFPTYARVGPLSSPAEH